MGLIVQKFGGSSVRDAERVFNVASRVIETYDAGNDVVVVVSAQGDTTDDLIEKAKEINTKASKREMDVLLSAGEQISMSLLAMAIEKLGRPVVSLTGWQAGMNTDSNYSKARIKRVVGERIHLELDKKKIVIVAGFQGINKFDDITTLGRGGSDTSAVAIAAALGADLCQIFTDVTGVYTADPRIVPEAFKLNEITYDEMLELASAGANVLHNRSVELAKKFNVNMEVLSSLEKVPGTIVKEENTVEKMLIRGIARDNDIARIALVNINDTPGKAFQIFSILAKKKVNVDVILQSIGRDGSKDISFTVSKDDLETALNVINENNSIIGAEKVIHDENVSKVSVVGAGMTSNPGVAATMFEALYDAGINIQMISTSEIRVSVLIDRKDAENAVRAIHNKFNLHD
ncbi:MAG: aspartate kinase [Clostridia bacterium]|nr:aspartate kinase [Clostridia bacterium]MBQ6937626.1 aspartate kinase [Clostridia bacterium]MBR2883512.1 aspartate kinase [Clostridia bacterium]